MSDRINVIRAPRDSEHQYFAISRALTQDNRLSFEARGILAYLLSKPSDWEVRVSDLMREGNCGRDRIYRILKELKDAGYLHRDREHLPNGAFTWGPYRVYEEPFTENTEMDTPHKKAARPFTEKPDTAQPYTALPYTEKPHIYKRERSTEERVREKAPAPAESQAVQVYTRITERRPSKVEIELMSDVTDLGRWEREIKNWLASGYKRENVKGMLDWYHGKGKHQQNGKPEPVARTITAPRPTKPADARPPQEVALALKQALAERAERK